METERKENYPRDVRGINSNINSKSGWYEDESEPILH